MKQTFAVTVLLAVFTLNIYPTAELAGRVFWRGSVDDKIHLIISGANLRVETISGKVQGEGAHSFTAELPREEVTVSVNKQEGRGTATVVQQPTAENDYTAIIEVYDNRGGARVYQVDISWQ